MRAKAKLDKILDRVEKFAQLIASIATIMGIGFIIFQMNIMKQQNVIQERALQQSYRPLGKPVPDSTITITSSIKGKFTGSGKEAISVRYSIINKGAGVLVYIGSLSCFTTKKIDLRNVLVHGKIDTTKEYFNILHNTPSFFIKEKGENIGRIIFDTRPANSRLDAVVVNDSLSTNIHWLPVGIHDHYYYCLFFYKDIAGNLYDSLCLRYLRFDKSPFSFTSPDQETYVESYGTYTRDEQNNLSKNLLNINHSISSAISRGQY